MSHVIAVTSVREEEEEEFQPVTQQPVEADDDPNEDGVSQYAPPCHY